MGMVTRNHELFESGVYSYGFAPEADAWQEFAEDRGSDTSASISIESLELNGDLDPSVNLAVPIGQLGGVTSYGRPCVFFADTFVNFRSEPPDKVLTYYFYRVNCKNT
ncbi:hypothetical protein AYI68_g3617 [Smittium mucronatum]|uniref:Uncharacterized protein n=1 Tax=Smittium mucronatum TaxID=133383 RepID=A0A1R0GZC9_9FUNG|nr:hypothetical protein AYI68_g3617 [Smittium mucronatum]